MFPTFLSYIYSMKNISYITPTLHQDLYLLSFAKPFRVKGKYADRVVRKRFNDAMARHYSGSVIIFKVTQIDERNFRILALTTPKA